jgi:hypothetical protein
VLLFSYGLLEKGLETKLQSAQDAPVFESSKHVKAMPERVDRPRMLADFLFSNLCMGDFRSRFFAA